MTDTLPSVGKTVIKISTDPDGWLTHLDLECLALFIHWVVLEGLTIFNNCKYMVTYSANTPTITWDAILVTKVSGI